MRRSLLLLLILTACTTTTPPAGESKPHHDKPGEAAEYYAMKRQGADDPHARYAAARDVMRRMPHYSTVDDAPGARRIRSEAEGGREINKWTFLGPGNIGGRTRVLIIDTQNPRVMYSGGVSGGLWKTVSGGERWEPIGDDLANLAVNSLVMHPTDHQTLYAGTGEGYFREEQRGTNLPLRGNGIFVTRDGGDTWTHLASTKGEDFHWVNDLEISPREPNRLYAATRTGLWRSDDAGTTWSRMLDPKVKGGCLDLVRRDGTENDYLFASCGTFEQATVYRNRNVETGGAWEPVLSEPFMGRTTVAIAPSDPSIVYALSASNEPGIYNQGLLAVFRSNANGDAGSWTAQVTNKSTDYLSTLLLTNPVAANNAECSPNGQNQYVTMGWYCNTIAVDPKDPNKVWAAGVDLFRSDDGGRSFGLASYWWALEGAAPSFAHADQHAIVFHPQYDGATNKTMFAMNDGGVYRTDDARADVARGKSAPCSPGESRMSFVSLNHNYGITQFYHGAVFPDGRRFAGGAQDNGTVVGSIDGGPDRWIRVFGGDGAYVAVDPNDARNLYVEYQFANVFKSTDGGEQFRRATTGLNDNFLFITPFVLDPNDSRRLWIGGRRMWRTDNSADLWKPAGAQLDGLISAIAVAPGNSNAVVAGTNSGVIARTANGSTATGTTVWPSVKPRDGFVSSLAFDPTNANVAYATYSGFGGTHVWKSIDGGATWSGLDGTGDGVLPDIPVHAIAVDPTRPARLFLGTDLGVFVSIDGGAHWQVENSGFAAVVTEAVVIGPGGRGPAVYAFTHGRGAWRAELVPAGVRRRVVRP